MTLRLDQALVARGLSETRSKARDLILRGRVRIDGVEASKPGKIIDASVMITVADNEQEYVSRGGLKLASAIKIYDFSAKGRVAIDVGASTGGFTDVLLRHGSTHVYAVDVGHSQLHASLRNDARVTNLENTDARTLNRSSIALPVDTIVCDASFISLSKVLSAAMALAAPGAWMVALIKPQFELEPTAIRKGGIVKSEKDRNRAITNVTDWLDQCSGWRCRDVIESPITGKGGNVEYLVGADFHG